jgi:hypothetical protein
MGSRSRYPSGMLETAPTAFAARQRWRPLPSGYVALARITICRRADGEPDFRTFDRERWCTLMLEVRGSNYYCRRIWQKLVVEGTDAAKAPTRLAITAWLSCHENPINDRRISRLDGLIVALRRASSSASRARSWLCSPRGRPAPRPPTGRSPCLPIRSMSSTRPTCAWPAELDRSSGWSAGRVSRRPAWLEALPGRSSPQAPDERELRPADERWRMNAERALSAMAAGTARVRARECEAGA